MKFKRLVRETVLPNQEYLAANIAPCTQHQREYALHLVAQGRGPGGLKLSRLLQILLVQLVVLQLILQ